MAHTRVPIKLLLLRQTFRLAGYVVPGLAATWAYRLWFATRRFRETEHDLRWRQQAQHTILEQPYGKVAVYRWGEQDKPVVVCVHGWSGHASQFATMLPTLLKAGYQVLAFDAPGHGKSEGKSTNIFRIGDALKTIVAPYSSVEAIISHSFGGMVSAYAIKHLSVPVQKLIMIASPVSSQHLLYLFATSLCLNQSVMQRIRNKFQKEFGEDVFAKVSAEENLKHSQLPILLIHDKHDMAVNWENSERIVKVANNAVVIYTEGHGHRRLLRDKRLIKKIVQFIQTGKS